MKKNKKSKSYTKNPYGWAFLFDFFDAFDYIMIMNNKAYNKTPMEVTNEKDHPYSVNNYNRGLYRIVR